MTRGARRGLFLAAAGGLAALYLWGLAGLPGFGRYPGPYGDVVNAVAVAETHATAAVSAVNFGYRAIDTLGEELILLVAVTGVTTVLRRLRAERETPAADEAQGRDVPATSDAVRLAAVTFVGPTALVGWYLTSHAQTSPAGGFQGGAVLATAFALVYLAGQFLVLERISPVDVVDAVEGIGAGGFVAVGVVGLASGMAYLANWLPLGTTPGAVDSSGTIALLSFFVGVEVMAAFLLVVAELLEQTLIIRGGKRS